MEMKCPNCGSEEPDYVMYCGKCGGPMKESEQSTDSPEKSENAMQEMPAILKSDGIDKSYEISPYLTGDLEGGGAWWPMSGPDGQAGVSLEGTIHNSGTEDMVAVVHIRVFDGNRWLSFTENAGVVPAGGDVGFDWSQGLGQIDDNAVLVEYDISKGWEVEVARPEPRPVEDNRDLEKKRSWEWHWQKGSG